MNEGIMISIAMATYNGEKYLREQLDSIFSQTHQNFELVICDDCSTDGTVGILREYETQDPRVHVYVNESNLGFKKNFERAISLCKGEYIALSDQDDIWLPEHLEVLYKTIRQKNSLLACGNSHLVDSNGCDLRKNANELGGFYELRYLAKPELKILFAGNFFWGHDMLMVSSFVHRFLPVPEQIPVHDIWFALCASLENVFAYTFEVITKFRQHQKSATIAHRQKIKRNLFVALRSKCRVLIKGSVTNKFEYCDALDNYFDASNERYDEVRKIIRNIQYRHLTFSDIRFLWKNYQFIAGRKGHHGFLKKLIIWSRWKREDQ